MIGEYQVKKGIIKKAAFLGSFLKIELETRLELATSTIFLPKNSAIFEKIQGKKR